MQSVRLILAVCLAFGLGLPCLYYSAHGIMGQYADMDAQNNFEHGIIFLIIAAIGFTPLIIVLRNWQKED
jgi:hypothetical protein